MPSPDLHVVLSCAGWVGAIGTTAAYALVSRRRLAADSRAFQGTNALGATALAASAAAAHSWPSTAVNVLWAVIGLQAYVAASTWQRRQQRRELAAAAAAPTATCGCADATAGRGDLTLSA